MKGKNVIKKFMISIFSALLLMVFAVFIINIFYVFNPEKRILRKNILRTETETKENIYQNNNIRSPKKI